ncbi:hypothetical protein GIB67_021153 [Kingdonia uniflora]|uniref:SHSP domain-containing protein n=1 Tax=Kingdonia uniflora TaxID=39325 RepID=A0A7J7N7K4_9MAGN|nr:hypothetical protein GIB67_021153 [Kingdonia uniflora]
MSSRKQVEDITDDQTLQKWNMSLRKDVFDSFISRSEPILHKIFTGGSLFSPLLFGKFFDPSDAFSLWVLESEVQLSRLCNSGQSTSDWFETEVDYNIVALLKAGVKKYSDVQICVENGMVLEISGQWRPQQETGAKDWRSEHWWVFGYARRLKLLENSDWRKIKANVDDEIILEMRIPKNHLIASEESKPV